MCQKILKKFLPLFLQYKHNGPDFTAVFLLRCESRKQVRPSLVFEIWLPSENKKISICCYCLFVLVPLRMPVHFSKLTFKTTEIVYSPACDIAGWRNLLELCMYSSLNTENKLIPASMISVLVFMNFIQDITEQPLAI